MQLKTYFSATPDHRQAPGRRYNIGHLPLFSVLAVVLGSISYRKIQRFMNAHRERLNAPCQLHWKRAPAHTSIRHNLQSLDPEEIDAVFRRRSSHLDEEALFKRHHARAV